ncbi:hypothetical protein HHX47_DHR1002019 [Lentinula edodes]|nr:hypothetical protein HHX47_DHR1002019 [Lentinula edodes]
MVSEVRILVLEIRVIWKPEANNAAGRGGRLPPIMMSSLQSLREKLQAASVDFQKVQVDLSNVVEARQRLDAQLSENELVKKIQLIPKPIAPPAIKGAQKDMDGEEVHANQKKDAA